MIVSNPYFRSSTPKQVVNHPTIDLTESNNAVRTERMPPVVNKQQFEFSFDPIEDVPPPPPTKQQPLKNPKFRNSLSEYFSNFQCGLFSRQDSAGNPTTSSICSLPPSPDASPRLAKRKIDDPSNPSPKNCLETCPMEDFEDLLEFLFSL